MPVGSSGKLRPRLISGAKQSPLAVFNDSAEDQTDQIVLPSGYRRARNLHSQEEIVAGEKGIRVTVQFQDVAVFLLES